MSGLFEQVLSWVSLHPVWAGIIVFLVAMAESLAIVGVLVPGVAMMFGVGALISAGALEFWPTVAWAVAGAVLGDGLSFFLGRHFQDHLPGLWPFSRHPEMLQRGIDFFQRYGGKSVVFGRFVGPVRAVIPLVAGMLRMPPGRFLAANVASA
ncbi:MAG: DedA family protein, partial [Gammaproteobacteria bacterium]